MAKYRPIMIKIWNDSWFLSLTDTEKVFWFFLLTNPYFHISGIYELPKPLISTFQGGGEMLKKFEGDGKIIYKEGWILIKNYLKNQAEQLQKKDNIYKSIYSYLSENTKLIDLFNLRDEDPYKTLIRPLSKVVKSKVVKSKEESNKEESIVSEETSQGKEVNEILNLFETINPSYKRLFANKTQRGATERLLKQYGREKLEAGIKMLPDIICRKYAPRITTPVQLEEKMADLKIYIQQEQDKKLKITKL